MSTKASIYAVLEDKATAVRAVIRYPHDARADYFVERVECTHNGRTILKARLTPGVAREPYLAFSFEGGAAGDALELKWNDSAGGNGTATGVIR